MGLFDAFKKKTIISFAEIDSIGKGKSFKCTPEYKEKSVIPCRITISSGKDGVEVFKETIEVW